TQEVIDCLHANSDGASRLVLVQVLEAEIRRARLLDDALNYAVDRRIVPALEAGQLQRYQVRMPGRKLCRPYLVIRAARIRILPRIRDIKRTADHTGSNFIAKQPLEQILINRQRV